MEIVQDFFKEYCRDDEAVREHTVKLLGIPVYKSVSTSTNAQIMQSLQKPKSKPIKGFNT